MINELPEARLSYRDEARDVITVIVDDLITEIEYVHKEANELFGLQ
jgi:hypothetical protein